MDASTPGEISSLHSDVTGNFNAGQQRAIVSKVTWRLLPLLFFCYCVSTGELYPCEITERLCDVLKTGDIVTVDLDKSTVTVQATGKVYHFKPLGDVRPVVDAGGLFNYARKTGMIPA